MLTGGSQLLVELQDLLLQGVQATQTDLAFLLSKLPLLLLLCLWKLEVENRDSEAMLLSLQLLPRAQGFSAALLHHVL